MPGNTPRSLELNSSICSNIVLLPRREALKILRRSAQTHSASQRALSKERLLSIGKVPRTKASQAFKNNMSRNQNLVQKWSTQNHIKNLEGGRNYFWLGLPLTNLHLPGFSLWLTCRWSVVFVPSDTGPQNLLRLRVPRFPNLWVWVKMKPPADRLV